MRSASGKVKFKTNGKMRYVCIHGKSAHAFTSYSKYGNTGAFKVIILVTDKTASETSNTNTALNALLFSL
jgi:hypothetical protein